MMGFAALTSCVSVMETLVANCMEVFHQTRKKMCGLIGVYSLVTAVLICLGYNVLYFELPLPNGSTDQDTRQQGNKRHQKAVADIVHHIEQLSGLDRW